MFVETEILKAFFVFLAFSRPSSLTLWLFFIRHLAPKALLMKCKPHATRNLRSHAATAIVSTVQVSWFDNGCVTPRPTFHKSEANYILPDYS
jgi:hypothetical protein